MRRFLNGLRVFTLVLGSTMCVSATASAQTDWIAWKSRGSDMAGFSRAFELRLEGETPAGNFGLSPEQTALRRLALDSVRFLTDTSAVLYTSAKVSINSKDAQAKKMTQADTIIHPRPSKRKQAVPELQQYLQQQYPFQPASDSIPFLGFPNKQKRRQAFVLPTAPATPGQPPMGQALVWTWLTILLLSAGAFLALGKLQKTTDVSYGG